MIRLPVAPGTGDWKTKALLNELPHAPTAVDQATATASGVNGRRPCSAGGARERGNATFVRELGREHEPPAEQSDAACGLEMV